MLIKFKEIKNYIIVNKLIKEYALFIMVIVAVVFISAVVHTYLNFNNPSIIIYWVLSFITIFIETVATGLILTLMISALQKASDRRVAIQREGLKIQFEEQIILFDEIIESCKERESGSFGKEYLQARKDIEKLKTEMYTLLLTFDDYTVATRTREIKIKSFKIFDLISELRETEKSEDK